MGHFLKGPAASFLSVPVLFLFVFAAAFIFFIPGQVFGLEKNKALPVPPVLSRCELYQLGASELVLSLSGRNLPEPEISFEDSRVRVVLKNSRLDDNAAASPVDYASVIPLLSDMKIEQASGDAVLELVTAAPLRLRYRHGSPPSNRYTLRMITEEEDERAQKNTGLSRSGAPAPPDPVRLFSGGSHERTTLDLRDIELRDVFRMLGTALNKNIILDTSFPSVSVTLLLKDVLIGDALDYLMKTYNISCWLIGRDTLVMGTRDGLSRLSGREEIRAFRIAYADPVVLQELLVRLTGLPPERFVVDARLRNLYVTSNPLKLSEVAGIIQSLDRPGRQVMIHAQIFEFADGATREVETALNAVYRHWWFSYSGQSGGRGGYDDSRRLRGEFDASFRAIESRGGGRTLANPSVIVIDGQEASVSLTEEYPYISSRSDSGTPSWSMETIGPKMTLTPRTGRDGIISLQINVSTGEVLEMITGSTGEEMPRTSTRSIKTHIRVRDGEPFVIGGLFMDSRTRQRIQIPVIGQIPFLGEFFHYRRNVRSKTQGVILVIPYILDTPDAPVEQEELVLKY